MEHVRVRFAPSPTGHLHIGGLRTAIFNWLFARHEKGDFLLRIEDTDLERSKQEYTESILASLAWMHIDWDEPYVVQSKRIKEHQLVVNQLLAQRKAYKCYCTQEDVLARRPALAVIEGETFTKYDGYCATRTDAPNKPAAIRFKLPEDMHVISFDDLIRGPISIEIDQLDDFVIVRSDGTPMYNFVVVVDDAYSKITHVIRGEDHISNTPKQILLYQACGYALPQFGHLPNILGPDGHKLSKRNAATSVIDYKENGYLPEALFNYLVRLGWAHGDQEIFTLQEMIQYFTLDHVGRKGAIFDQVKLDWMNGHYMRNTPDEHLLEVILKDIQPSLLTDFPLWSKEQILILINIYKQRAKTLKEIIQDMQAFYHAPQKFSRDDIKQWLSMDAVSSLQDLIEQFQTADQFTHDALSALVKEYSKKKNIKLVSLAQPLRIALIGKSSGPGVFELMPILGKKESIERITTLIHAVTKNQMIE
jgi:glutamyl-tRNA synthetase